MEAFDNGGYSLRVWGCLGYEMGGQATPKSIDPDSQSARAAAAWLATSAGIPFRETIRMLRRLWIELVSTEVVA